MSGERRHTDEAAIRDARTFSEGEHDDGAVSAAEAISGPEPLKLAVGEEEAKAGGICPVCEGYGGGEEPEGHEDSDCIGACDECWCPGCHDGQDFPEDRIDEEPCGSWLAYELIHGATPDSNTREEAGE